MRVDNMAREKSMAKKTEREFEIPALFMRVTSMTTTSVHYIEEIERKEQ